MNSIPFIVAQTGIPVILRSGAGTAKTSIIEKFAEFTGRNFYPIALNSRDREDVTGYPVHQTDKNVVEFIHDSELSIKEPAIIFFDELNTAPEHVRVVAQRVINEKYLGGRRLGDVWFFAAGNPPGVSAGAQPFDPALVNRCAVFDWEPPVNWWLPFMLTSGVEFLKNRLEGKNLSRNTWSPNFPKLDKEKYLAEVERNIPIFVKFFTSFTQHLKEPDINDPYSSIRSATNSLAAYCAVKSVDNLEDITVNEAEIAALKSCVGDKTALKLLQFIKSVDLPDPIDVLEGRVPFPSTNEHDKAHMVLMALIQKINRIEMLNKVLRFVEKIYKDGRTELASFAVSQIGEKIRSFQDKENILSSVKLPDALKKLLLLKYKVL